MEEANSHFFSPRNQQPVINQGLYLEQDSHASPIRIGVREVYKRVVNVVSAVVECCDVVAAHCYQVPRDIKGTMLRHHPRKRQRGHIVYTPQSSGGLTVRLIGPEQPCFKSHNSVCGGGYLARPGGHRITFIRHVAGESWEANEH